MARFERRQFDIQNLEIYKDISHTRGLSNSEKINYSIYKSKFNEFDIKSRGETSNNNSNNSNTKLYPYNDDNDKDNDNFFEKTTDNYSITPVPSTRTTTLTPSDKRSVIEFSDISSETSSSITATSDKFSKVRKVKQQNSISNFFSFYDIIDPTMCFQSCYNHALLVNNVYPKAGEEGAKTNNLSFLMFYAKSRPQKLIKVGNYLEKRAKRDIWNSRQE